MARLLAAAEELFVRPQVESRGQRGGALGRPRHC